MGSDVTNAYTAVVLANENGIDAASVAAIMSVAEDQVESGERGKALTVLLEVMPLSQAMAHVYPIKPRVGDMLVSSWGYDQTNIDFYQVTKVTKSSVWIRKVRGQVAEARQYDDLLVPVRDAFAEDKAHVHRWNLVTWPGLPRSGERDWQYQCRLGSKHGGYSASLWDGASRAQTGSGYGH